MPLPDRDALAEMWRRHIALLQHFAGLSSTLRIDDSPQAGALVQDTVEATRSPWVNACGRAGTREISYP